MQEEHAEQIVELLDRRSRRRSAARENQFELQARQIQLRAIVLEPSEEVEPDRWNAARLRALLLFEQHVDALGIELRAGKHQLRAAHRGRKRQAPGIGVKQRHHDEDRIARREREAVGRTGGEGVQDRRAMAVEHAFRVAGGPRGVAERAGRILVELWPVIVCGGRRDQFLVAEQVLHRELRHLASVAQRHPAAHQRELRRQHLDQGREDRIEEDKPVLGMMHDVLKLFRKQSRVDGVQHAAGAGDAVIGLEMPIAVPRQRRDAIAMSDPERVECARDPFRPRGDLRIVGAVKAAFRVARNDLTIAMPRRGVIDQTGNEQRTLLHESEHDESPHVRVTACYEARRAPADFAFNLLSFFATSKGFPSPALGGERSAG